MNALLQITAGTGPAEVARFVAGLTPHVIEAAHELGVYRGATITHGDPDTPRSVGLIVDASAQLHLEPWLGTHCWVHRSATRGKKARKRWFAGVGLFPLPAAAPALDPDDVEVRTCRAGGPGGQHVNTADSAVIAVHRPSGLRVRADGERSQHANRRLAFERLAEALARRDAQRRGDARARARHAHFQLERGRPVMSWVGDPLVRRL